MTEPERLNEYLICKDRGHAEMYSFNNRPEMPKTVLKDSDGKAKYCKHCNVWYWDITVRYEGNVPKHPKGKK